MVEYKGYFIFGYALRVDPTSSDRWRSRGSVYTGRSFGRHARWSTNAKDGSVLIKSLDGSVIFESQRAAQDHGLELCKKWIDEKSEHD
jgi:hypothetical protein